MRYKRFVGVRFTTSGDGGSVLDYGEMAKMGCREQE